MIRPPSWRAPLLMVMESLQVHDRIDISKALFHIGRVL
jgi:hypothetical protein